MWDCSTGTPANAASRGAATPALWQASMAASTVTSSACRVCTPAQFKKSSCAGVASLQPCPAAPRAAMIETNRTKRHGIQVLIMCY